MPALSPERNHAMQNIQNAPSTISHLASLLDDLSAGCDPDFDAAYEELDREFAEVRLHLGNE
jgi:hypothetical protein